MSAADVGTWAGTGFSVIGLAVSVAGFWLAIAQIRKTRSSVEAAAAAIARTERHLVINHLLIVLSQLPQLEEELHRAVVAADADAASASLARWRYVGAEVLGILSAGRLSDAGFEAALRDSVAQSVAARGGLLRSKQPVETTTRKVRAVMSDVVAQSAELVGRLRAYTGEDISHE